MRRLFFALPLVFGAFAANAQESSPIKLELGGFMKWFIVWSTAADSWRSSTNVLPV